jgi:hypothetical protein
MVLLGITRGEETSESTVGASVNPKRIFGEQFLRAPGRTRTYDARFRKPTLYPLSYGGKLGIWSSARPSVPALSYNPASPFSHGRT